MVAKKTSTAKRKAAQPAKRKAAQVAKRKAAQPVATAAAREPQAKHEPQAKRVGYSIVSEAECSTLQGVKMSAVGPSPSGLYRVRVTHDDKGNANGFEVEPHETEGTG